MLMKPSDPSGLLNRIADSMALRRAWRKVRANRGAAGIDAVSCLAFEQTLDGNLEELSRNLLSRSYEPLPARTVSIPKTDGTARELAIPCVRDRVAQRAVLDEIEPLFEPRFLDCSFAFRPGRSVEMAVQKIVVSRAQGYTWTLEADVSQFFPSIDHCLLLAEVGRVVHDGDVLRLLRQWLDAGILGESGKSHAVSGVGEVLATAQLAVREAVHDAVEDFVGDRLGEDSGIDNGSDDFGPEASLSVPNRRKAAVRRVLESGALLALAERATLVRFLSPQVLGLGCVALAAAALAPAAVRRIRALNRRSLGAAQGSPISPLLSNIHLHPFDAALHRRGYRLVRYCDDFVIPCRTMAEATDALAAVKDALAARRLSLHPGKTRIVAPTETFEFLGYRFLPGNRVAAPPSLPETTRASLAAALRRVAARLEP